MYETDGSDSNHRNDSHRHRWEQNLKRPDRVIRARCSSFTVERDCHPSFRHEDLPGQDRATAYETYDVGATREM